MSIEQIKSIRLDALRCDLRGVIAVADYAEENLSEAGGDVSEWPSHARSVLDMLGTVEKFTEAELAETRAWFAARGI